MSAEIAGRLGTNLARCRRRARLSQEEVGHRASLHRTEVGLLERGERLPRIDTVLKLAGALEVEVAELVEGIGWVRGDYRAGAFALSSEDD